MKDEVWIMQHKEPELTETVDLAENHLPVEVWLNVFNNFSKKELQVLRMNPSCRLFWRMTNETSLINKGPLDYSKPVGSPKIALTGIEYNSKSYCIALDDHHLALATDSVIYIIATRNGEVIRKLEDNSRHLGPVAGLVKLSHHLIACVYKDARQVYVWDVDAGVCVKKSSRHFHIDNIALVHDSKLLMYANQGVLRWDTNNDQVHNNQYPHYPPRNTDRCSGNHFECLLSDYSSAFIVFTYEGQGYDNQDSKDFYVYAAINNDDDMSLVKKNTISKAKGTLLSYCLVSDKRIAVMDDGVISLYEPGKDEPVAKTPFWPSTNKEEQWKMLSLGYGLVASYSPTFGCARIHDTSNLTIRPKWLPAIKDSFMVIMPDGSLTFINGSTLCRLDFEGKKLTLAEQAAPDSSAFKY